MKLGSFSRREVVGFLRQAHQGRWFPGSLGDEVEELTVRLPEMPLGQIRGYTELLLPHGRRGLVKFQLYSREYLRGYVFLVWLLRSITSEGDP